MASPDGSEGACGPAPDAELDPWYARAVRSETLLWALAVWLDPAGNPYAQRDLDAANAHLNRHDLTDADAMRNRLVTIHEQEGRDA